MSSIWGNNIKISLFGESHGKAIGVTIHNLPSGIKLDIEKIEQFMAKRSPGKNNFSSPRKEADIPQIISGFYNGYTTGTPLTAIIENTDTKSKDYEKVEHLARPSHADYAGYMRYKGYNDKNGGGHFSGRLTAPLVFAGAVCMQVLNEKGIFVGSHIKSIETIVDDSFDFCKITREQIKELSGRDFPVLNHKKGRDMQKAILGMNEEKDSLGGIIECAVIGMKAGIGNPIFDGIENRLSSIIFGIPAIKGIEFGLGFDLTKIRGSKANDEIYYDGEVKTYTNNNGGINGGISNGMPIVFRVAIKPTPSIAKPQKTINMKTLERAVLETKGRHDPCIVLRALSCVEGATAIALLDLLMGANA